MSEKRIHANRIKEVFNDSIIRIFLLVLVCIAAFPFVYMIIISLIETNTMTLTWEKLKNAAWTLNYYKRLYVGSGNFLEYLLNSFIMSLYACLVTCVFSTMAAYAFAKKRFLGRDKIYYAYLLTMMIPGHAVLIPQFLMIRALNLMDTYTGLALPFCCIAYGVLLMRSFMKGLPDELLEAADIDGCNEIKKFIVIIIPLVKPAIISLAIYTFITVWGNLLWPLIITSGGKTTVTLAVSALTNGLKVTEYGYVMAGATSAFVFPFVLYLLLQKQFVEGIALSGIKG